MLTSPSRAITVFSTWPTQLRPIPEQIIQWDHFNALAEGLIDFAPSRNPVGLGQALRNSGAMPEDAPVTTQQVCFSWVESIATALKSGFRV